MKKSEMLAAFKEMCSMYGKRAKGIPKTKSKAMLAQRKAAGRASALAKGSYKKQIEAKWEIDSAKHSS